MLLHGRLEARGSVGWLPRSFTPSSSASRQMKRIHPHLVWRTQGLEIVTPSSAT